MKANRPSAYGCRRESTRAVTASTRAGVTTGATGSGPFARHQRAKGIARGLDGTGVGAVREGDHPEAGLGMPAHVRAVAGIAAGVVHDVAVVAVVLDEQAEPVADGTGRQCGAADRYVEGQRTRDAREAVQLLHLAVARPALNGWRVSGRRNASVKPATQRVEVDHAAVQTTHRGEGAGQHLRLQPPPVAVIVIARDGLPDAANVVRRGRHAERGR